MSSRQKIGGRSSFGLYAGLIGILALAILLVVVFLVVVPDRQRQREEAARTAQATAAAEAETAELQRAYGAGIVFESAGDWNKAVEEFAKVVSLNPSYKDASERLVGARIRAESAKAAATKAAVAGVEAAQATVTAEARLAVETAYQRGLAFAQAALWDQAKAEFEQVVSSDPAYKDVQIRLAETVAGLAKMVPTDTPIPLATATPASITLKPVSAISFQNEGTASTDDTSLIRDKDGYWGPSLTGTVTHNYYASGTNVDYFDALSLRFEGLGHSADSSRAVLRAFVQRGDYNDNIWNHYLALPGDQNPDYQDTPLDSVPNTQAIDYSSGKWIEIDLSPKFWSEGTIWVTLRLWNVRVDAVELKLTPK